MNRYNITFVAVGVWMPSLDFPSKSLDLRENIATDFAFLWLQDYLYFSCLCLDQRKHENFNIVLANLQISDIVELLVCFKVGELVFFALKQTSFPNITF